MNDTSPLLPDTDNPILAPHWKAAAQGRLAIPFCVHCDAPQWPPRTNCLVCHGFSFEWREIVGRGDLFTFFIARKALHPSLGDEVPYATGVVVLPAAVKMLGRLADVELSEIEIGMPMSARFIERVAGVTLVHWGPDT